MASLSLSTPVKPSIFPPPAAPNTLKPQSLLFKPAPPRARAVASISHAETKPSNLGLGLGLGFGTEENPYSLSFSPSSSAPPASARGSADVMGMLLRERIVFLGSQIDDFVADAIISQILLLIVVIDSARDIRLFINSPGGSLSATMAIFDVVQLVRADVSTIGLGIAASTSSIILGGQAIDVEIQACRKISTEIATCPQSRLSSMVSSIDGVIDRDSIIPLMPVTDELVKPKLNYEEVNKDPRKFLTPEIPDDEIC